MKKEEALKQSEEAIKQLSASLKAGKSEALVQYLDFVSQFHHYSFNNCMLIALQFPQASHVAGFHHWKKLGRSVKKGSSGIGIFAPLIGRRRSMDSEPVGEESDEKRLFGFRVVHVFDISQTEGEELPAFPEMTGDPGQYLATLESLVRGKQIQLVYDDIAGGALGLSHGGKITIQQGLPDSQTFHVLAHEVAHEMLHWGDRRSETDKVVRETEAEAVAYIVCRAIGMDCSTSASDYIQLARGDETTLMQSLEHIRHVASEIISELTRISDNDVRDVA